jgi:hypothetical protein
MSTSRQPTLFDLPRKPRRVMMRLADAGPGHPNWAKFVCDNCGNVTETNEASRTQLRRGLPCMACGKPELR